jgi:hypothetical protein
MTGGARCAALDRLPHPLILVLVLPCSLRVCRTRLCSALTLLGDF